jgi:uncharacterized membrane protein (DUF4010 family)
VFLQVGIAVGLGLLVGLQRERTQSQLGGLRTFPVVTLFGTLCALLAQSFGGWTIAAGLVALAVLMTTMNIILSVAQMRRDREAEVDPGLTTEAAMLLMFCVGAYVVTGYVEVAIALGGGLAVLLYLKGQLHGIAAKLEEADIKAIMQFALISLVILPVLPNETYGPYDVLNPRNIWLMVVLIVGISLGGYIIYKFVGSSAGLVLGGILGGLISSTATTVSYARRTANAPDTSSIAAVVLTIASAIVYGRLLIEIAAVAPGFLRVAAGPIGVMLGLSVLLSAAAWFARGGEDGEMPPQGNPAELKAALFFGFLYAVVLFVVAAVKERFGAAGLYIVAAISGLTDVDAITLSTAKLVDTNHLGPDTAWRIIILASLSNLVFKAGIVAALGNRRLLMRVLVLFGIIAAASIAVLLLWPDATPPAPAAAPA